MGSDLRVPRSQPGFAQQPRHLGTGRQLANFNNTSNARGFSLIELLIVVTVVVILATLAIPSLSKSKMAANEAAAIAYMRTWTAAQELYRQRFGVYADADNQLVFEQLIGVDRGDRLGYRFQLDNPSGSQHLWWGQGVPEVPGQTGSRFFYIDSTGVIRFEIGSRATAASLPLGSP